VSDVPNHTATADPGLVARLASKARGLSEQLKTTASERDTWKTRATELETKVTELGQRADDSAAAKRVEELTAELRGLKHRAVFDRVAGKLKARPEAIDDLWTLSGYKPEADQVDEATLEKLIGDVKTRKGFLFAPDDAAGQDEGQGAGAASEPPRPGPGAGRAAPAQAPGKFALKPSDVRNPEWWRQHSKAYLEAVQQNNVHWLPEQ
jgi:hypothetical protein